MFIYLFYNIKANLDEIRGLDPDQDDRFSPHTHDPDNKLFSPLMQNADSAYNLFYIFKGHGMSLL